MLCRSCRSRRGSRVSAIFQLPVTPDNCSPDVGKGGGDPALGDLVLAFEALGVDAQHDLDAVTSPFGDLGCGYSSVEPARQACVAKVVWAAGEGER